MQRRDFMLMTAAVTLGLPLQAGAAVLAYRPGLVEQELNAGKTVFLDFYASWCGTCAAQHRVIDALKAENPAYEREITFIQVDWDQYKSDALTKELNIPRRSTLVVLKGDAELGRIVAGTSRATIKELLDLALGAATA